MTADEQRQGKSAGEELDRFSFWLRYPPRGRRPMGDATVRTYLYTIRRFHGLLDGREATQKGAEEVRATSGGRGQLAPLHRPADACYRT